MKIGNLALVFIYCFISTRRKIFKTKKLKNILWWSNFHFINFYLSKINFFVSIDFPPTIKL